MSHPRFLSHLITAAEWRGCRPESKEASPLPAGSQGCPSVGTRRQTQTSERSQQMLTGQEEPRATHVGSLGLRRQPGDTARFPRAPWGRGLAQGAVSSGWGLWAVGLWHGDGGALPTRVGLDPPSPAGPRSQKEAAERATHTWKLLQTVSTGACNLPVEAKPLWFPLAKMGQRRPERLSHLRGAHGWTGTGVWPRPGRRLTLLHPGDSGNHWAVSPRKGGLVVTGHSDVRAREAGSTPKREGSRSPWVGTQAITWSGWRGVHCSSTVIPRVRERWM